MAITSVGYSGSIGWSEWAQLMATLGVDYLVAGTTDLVATITGASAGEVTVSAGTAAGRGVIDTLDAPELVTGLTAPNTWYTIVLRRDWTGGVDAEVTTLEALEGGSARAIAASRETGPSIVDDQPIALVHRGATALDEVVDLRAWWGNGCLEAASQDALAYLARPGSAVQVGSTLWRYPVGGSSWEPLTVAWSSVTGKPSAFPPTGHTHSAGDITSGTLGAARVPNLPTSKITSGVLDDARMGASRNPTANSVAKRDQSGGLWIAGRGNGGLFFDNGSCMVGTTSGGSIFLRANGNYFLEVSAGSGRIGAQGSYDTTVSGSANVHINPNGLFSRVSSSRRYKADIRDADPLERLLDIRPRTWVAKHADEEGGADPDERFYGAIAEELDELDLDELVIYDELGRPEAIAYDRIGLALIPIVRAQAEQIESLRSELSELAATVQTLNGATRSRSTRGKGSK